MKRQMRQILGLSAFAAVCMALGMGLSYRWVARATEDKPVVVDARNLDRMPPIAAAAEKLNPTVVAITNTSFVKSKKRGAAPINPFGGDDFFDWFFGPQRPQTPDKSQGGDDDVQRLQAGGSGVIVSPDGEILTNFHVVDGLRGGEVDLEVKTADGRTYKAAVLGKDKELDIALIKIDAAHLPFAALGDSDVARVGEWVVAIGNPLGLEHTVTQGIISAKGRKLTGGLEAFLQTDAAINRGNSGGPLFNMDGEVIGVNTAILSPNGGSIGIGFAMSSAVVKNVVDQLQEFGETRRGWLGVRIQDVTPELADALGLAEAKGALVTDVPEGPAAEAGMQSGDVIVSFDGVQVGDTRGLVRQVGNTEVGKSVPVTVFRGGKTETIEIVLGRRETAEAVPASVESTKPVTSDIEGMEVSTLTDELRSQLDLPKDVAGLVVTQIDETSPAFEKGLRSGDVITEAGQEKVASAADLTARIDEARDAGRTSVLLLVRRGADPRFVALPVEKK